MLKSFFVGLALVSAAHAAPPDLIVTTAANATLTAGAYSYGTVQVQSGATLVIVGAVQISAASFQVQSGALVRGDGGGFGGGSLSNLTGSGPGGGGLGAGAGHGGPGALEGQAGGAAGTAYDLDDMPTQPGSGGGGGGGGNNGGSGGAALWVSSTSDVTINGTLSVNGANGAGGTTGAGGGSGGSIYLYGAVAGSGTLSARGGSGGNGTVGGGGGSGGILLVRTNGASCPSLTLDVAGGGAGTGTINGQGAGPGQANLLCPDLVVGDDLNLSFPASYAFNTITLASGGALFVGSAVTLSTGTLQQQAGTLTIDGAFSYSGGFSFLAGSLILGPGESLVYPSTLTLPAGSQLSLGANGRLSVSGSFLSLTGSSGTLQDGCLVSATGSFQDGGAWTSYGSTEVDCSDLVIPSGGTFNGSGNGYILKTGPGTPAPFTTYESAGGGGHGGIGGANGDSVNAGGPTYDNPNAPSQPGSGGGGWTVFPTHGGSGGAAIKFVASNGAALSGTVAVDGSTGAGDQSAAGGGGSGGSIYIVAANFWGNGRLSAQGGAGGEGSFGSQGQAGGGGGGGGLIYLDSTTGHADPSASGFLVKAVGGGGGGLGNGNGFPGSPGQYGDNFPPVLTVSDASVTLSASGPVNLILPVTLNKVSASTVTVQFATADLSATAGMDYTAAGGTLTFSPGQTVQDITVTVLAQTVDQFPISFAVNLSNAVNAGIVRSAVATIINPNPPTAVSINDASLVAGVSGTAAMDFAATLLSPSGKTISVHYATSNGSATSPPDYVAVTGTVTFAPGVTSQTVAVAVDGTLLDKFPETFSVTLSAPVNVNLSRTVGVGTIDENPAAVAPVVTVYPASATSSAGSATQAKFLVGLDQPSGKTIQVGYQTLSGTAGAANFTAQSGTLTFTEGQVSQTITVQVSAMPKDQAPLVFYLTLTSVANATSGVTETTGTIFDSVHSILSIGNAAVTVADASGPTLNAVFALTLTYPNEFPATVSYATVPVTAVQGVDYVGDTGTVTFAPGQTVQDLTVTVLASLVSKPALTYQVQLGNPVHLTISAGTATGTINNTVSCQLAVGNTTASTGSVSSTAVADFTVTLSHPNSLTVTVAYTTVSGTAAPGMDYTAGSGTVSFPPYSVSQTVAVNLVNHLIAEPTLSFGLDLSAPTHAVLVVATATAQIINVHAGPGLSVDSPSAPLSQGALVFTVTLNSPSGLPVSVSYATVDGSAKAPVDYGPAAGTLTFAPGQLSLTVSVTLPQNAPPKNNAAFGLRLSAPVNASLVQAGGTGTILAAWTPSRLGKTVLGPVPSKAGDPLCLYFVAAPASTHWEIFTIDQRRVATLDYGGAYAQCWQTNGVAPGIYRVLVNIKYTDGVTETKVFKAVIKP